MLFKVGKVKVSKGILQSSEISSAHLVSSFERYIRGDWGDIQSTAGLLNDVALTNGETIVATYQLDNGHVVCMSTTNGITSVSLQGELEVVFQTKAAMPVS